MARDTYVPPTRMSAYSASLRLEHLIRETRAWHSIDQKYRDQPGSWVNRFNYRRQVRDLSAALRFTRQADAALRELVAAGQS